MGGAGLPRHLTKAGTHAKLVRQRHAMAGRFRFREFRGGDDEQAAMAGRSPHKLLEGFEDS